MTRDEMTEEIAHTIADVFVKNAYVYVDPTHPIMGADGSYGRWGSGYPRVEMTPESLRHALTLALAAFAQAYHLDPHEEE